jgi:hypothetical protein
MIKPYNTYSYGWVCKPFALFYSFKDKIFPADGNYSVGFFMNEFLVWIEVNV